MSLFSINYYYTGKGLPTGNFQLSYDFGTSGSYVNNSGYYPQLSGNIVNLPQLFTSGRGYFNGNGYVKTQNVTGSLTDWTMIVSFEKTSLNEGVLFSNFSSGIANSGFVVGVNSANRLYLESYDENGPVLLENPTILSNKNAVSITKIGQGIYVDYLDFNSKTFESNKFRVSDSAFLDSKNWYVGGFSGTPSYFSGKYFNGFIDNFILLDTAIRPSEIGQVMRGLWNDIVSGQPQPNLPTIYSYGMRGICYLNKILGEDNTEIYLCTSGDNQIDFNKDAIYDRAQQNFFALEYQVDNGANLFVNGLGQYGDSGFDTTGTFYNYGYVISGDYKPSGNLFFSNGNYTDEDKIVYDSVTGLRTCVRNFSYSTGTLSVQVNSASDFVFFNGLKLVNGVDYYYQDSTHIMFSGGNDLYNGITGTLFTMPFNSIFKPADYYSGIFNSSFSKPFARNTSLFWLNGLRQNLGETYLETSTIDLISGSGVFSNDSQLFIDESNFWETF